MRSGGNFSLSVHHFRLNLGRCPLQLLTQLRLNLSCTAALGLQRSSQGCETTTTWCSNCNLAVALLLNRSIPARRGTVCHRERSLSGCFGGL